MSERSPSAPRVFLSYSWDPGNHKEKVLELAERLRREGVDAWIDRYMSFPGKGWLVWMEEQIRLAQFVLVIITEEYARRFSGQAVPGVGLGAVWEGAFIKRELHQAGKLNTKYIPVFLSSGQQNFVPAELYEYTRFEVFTESGYDDLYRLVTGQEIAAPQLGKVRRFASITPALPIHDPAAHVSNLPILKCFFGRTDELKRIAEVLDPTERTWGTTITGMGGIGKTTLAIQAAKAASGKFHRTLYLSAKTRELTDDGMSVIDGPLLQNYTEVLYQIATLLGRPEVIAEDQGESLPDRVRDALKQDLALLVLDNVEQLPVEDHDKLVAFVRRLPGECKALLTSRPVIGGHGDIIRLDRLKARDALNFLDEIAKENRHLAAIDQAQRQLLCEGSYGNPLLLRWVAGQLGRTGCETVKQALDLLHKAHSNNDPLLYMLGDLAGSCTPHEVSVLAAIACFRGDEVELPQIALVAGMNRSAASANLDALVARSLVTQDEKRECFIGLGIVSEYLRHKEPHQIDKAGQRLTDHVFALIKDNGYDKHDKFHFIDDAWTMVRNAFPIFLMGENSRLQKVCDMLTNYLNFSGRWKEWLELSEGAEARAAKLGDHDKAGWRAYHAGYVYYLRRQPEGVLASANRAETHWNKSKKVTRTEQGYVARLRGFSQHLFKDYMGAIACYEEALLHFQSMSKESEDVAAALNSKGNALRRYGASEGKPDDQDAQRRAEHAFDAAALDIQHALRIARSVRHAEGEANYLGTLAELALDRNDWSGAEKLALEALPLARQLGRKELIGRDCRRLARALIQQKRKAEALPLAQEAVKILTELDSPRVTEARRTLADCER